MFSGLAGKAWVTNVARRLKWRELGNRGRQHCLSPSLANARIDIIAGLRRPPSGAQPIRDQRGARSDSLATVRGGPVIRDKYGSGMAG